MNRYSKFLPYGLMLFFGQTVQARTVVAVRGDPLQDITVLQSVDVVVKGGLIFKQGLV